MRRYRYPDFIHNPDLQLKEHASFIACCDAWEKTLIKDLLEKNIPKSFFAKTLHVLDIGAGEGRMVHFFRHLFTRWTLIEPDIKRAATARKRFRKDKDIVIKKDVFANVPLEADMFDVIFCNHVAQHISENEWIRMVKKMNTVLKSPGYAVVAFSVKSSYFSTYNIERMQSGRRDMVSVSQKQFNAMAIAPPPDTLPIKKIALEEMTGQLEQNGFQILHYVYDHPISPHVPDRIVLWLLGVVPTKTTINLLQKIKYPHYLNCVLLAQKTASGQK